MVAAQILGAMLGLCFGYLAIVDIDYMKYLVKEQNDTYNCYEQYPYSDDCPFERNAEVPQDKVNIIAPFLPTGSKDFGKDSYYTKGF